MYAMPSVNLVLENVWMEYKDRQTDWIYVIIQ